MRSTICIFFCLFFNSQLTLSFPKVEQSNSNTKKYNELAANKKKTSAALLKKTDTLSTRAVESKNNSSQKGNVVQTLPSQNQSSIESNKINSKVGADSILAESNAGKQSCVDAIAKPKMNDPLATCSVAK